MAKPPRLRVLVLSSTYPRWAGDHEPAFVHELSRRLAERFEVVVLTPHAAGAQNEEQWEGVSIRRYRYAPASLETLVHHGGILTNLRRQRWKWLLLPGFLIGQWLALRKAVREFRPDVIHAHWLLPQGLMVAGTARNIPVLATSHGADLFGLRGNLFTWLRRKVLQRMGAVTVVSRAMQAKVMAEAPEARVEVMPMGVDVDERFRPDGRERSETELLFVGRLVEKKGLIHLLHALPAIRDAIPGVTLTIIGFGPEQQRLERAVRERGLQASIRFLGSVPQSGLAEHYQRAALFVAPFVEARGGDQEGLGLVVAEAMACQCPVVVGDVPGVRDLVNDDCGVRVQATDHAALAQAITGLLKDPPRRQQLATAGRMYVMQWFAWSSVADQYASLLETLAASKHG